MKALKLLGPLAVILVLVACAIMGCDATPSRPLVPTGTIRAVATGYDRCHWSVVIEGDNGSLWTVGIHDCRIPPVWAGLRGQFEYDQPGPDGYSSYFMVRKRLN